MDTVDDNRMECDEGHCVVDSVGISGPPDYRSMEVDENMINLLKKNVGVTKRWSSLAHALAMSMQKNQIQIQANVFMWDLSDCVLNLLEAWKARTGKQATLGRLLDALKKEEFNDVADQLTAKYSTHAYKYFLDCGKLAATV